MTMPNYFDHIRTGLCLSIALFALTACSENSSSLEVAADGASELKMTPPSFLTARAVIQDNLELEVTINNQSVAMQRSGDVWTGQTTVQQGSDVALEVLWSEDLDPIDPSNELLLLAAARENVNGINNDILFEVNDASYVTEGREFDADSDSFSNIVERQQDTDPFNPQSPGGVVDVQSLVRIPASGLPNDIDGVFNSEFWNNAQFQNLNGETLRIDNIIVDENGNNVVGEPNYQWAGIHDDEFLTLFIFAKSISPPAVNATRDSGTQQFNDDSLEIFWDGDFSRSRTYDAVDDMHIIIPLVRGTGATAQANKSGEADSEIRRGDNVNPAVEFDVDGVEFAACLCQGERAIWEVRINLEEARIPVGQTFGFEIQINQDDDGGERDSKWAWFSPARSAGDTNVDTDLTWRFPNTMGTMRLLPFPGS